MSVLAIFPLVALFVIPIAWRLVGASLGWYLRKKTDGRRCRILEVMEEDRRAFAESNKEHKGSDDEWENIDAHAVGTSGNGEKGEKEWDGIVGFFHPFWYVRPWCEPLAFDEAHQFPAMLEEVAKECYGVP
jgi:alpha-1,2-mannosyltransferase